MRRHVWSTLATSLVLASCSAPGAPVEELAIKVGPAIEEYLAEVDDAGKVRAVLVHHNGEPVVEQYVGAAAEDSWDTRSVTKSVMSTLVGIAIDEGHIDGVQDSLAELLPSRSAEMSEATAAVTLHQLLTHTGGFPAEGTAAGAEFLSSGDWVGQILTARNDSGTDADSFAYSDAGVHLVSAVLTEATGVPVFEYAREKLFDPLGIPTEPAFEPTWDFTDQAATEAAYEQYWDAGFAWGKDPQGLHEGACCIKLRPQDLARIGQLYLNDGDWDGRQIVSTEWIEQATSVHVERHDGGFAGYGYLWWITDIAEEPGFMAYGLGGQVIHVLPKHDLVVAIATEFDERDPARMSTILARETAARLTEIAITPHMAD